MCSSDLENGSGKSTFFKLLTNDVTEIGRISDDAVVQINGNVIFLNDETCLPPNLKEEDIAKYIFHINDISLKEKYVPIHSNRKIASYSNGERKLAVLRILSHLEFDILLADEYIVNIDEFNIEEVMNLLEKMSERGALIIISSNEVDIKNKFLNKITISNKKFQVYVQ